MYVYVSATMHTTQKQQQESQHGEEAEHLGREGGREK